MDTESVSSTPVVNEQFANNTGWTLDSDATIANDKITVTGGGESYKSISGLGKPENFRWDFTFTRNSGDAGDSSSVLLASNNGGYADPSSGQTNIIFYLANGNSSALSLRTNSGSGNVESTLQLGDIQATGTTKYYRVKKDGASLSVKRYASDSDRTADSSAEASATDTMDATDLSTWNTGSGNLTYIVLDGHGSGAWNYAISDYKVYDDGLKCLNDFSSTSDLEALSGVRTNSIFQQTDDTPTYWWYSGSAWLLDGTTQIIPTGTWNSSGYTNHSSFTQDSGKITYTCSAGNGQNGGAVASYDLGSGFDGDTNFIFRFRIKYTNQSDVSQANTSFSVGIGKEKTMTSSQGIFDSTDQIMWRWAGANNDEYRILTNVDGSNYQSSGQSFTPSTDTYYYFEIVRSGATSFTMNRYSDDTYKTVSDSESTTSAGNPNSLRYIQMGTSYDHQIGSWVAEVDEMKIQSGVSEWLE